MFHPEFAVAVCLLEQILDHDDCYHYPVVAKEIVETTEYNAESWNNTRT